MLWFVGTQFCTLEMRSAPKRASLLRMIGKEIIKQLPSYYFDNTKGEDVSVTAARKYIRKNKLGFNIIIEVKRTAQTVDRFYWCKRGLFSAEYAECNYITFPELKNHESKLDCYGKVYQDFERCSHLEIEHYRYEFRYG